MNFDPRFFILGLIGFALNSITFADQTIKPAQKTAEETAKEILITFGGDVNFNRSGQKPNKKGAYKGGFHSWASLSKGIKPLFNGDLNFINLETIVTDRQNLPATNKKFVFQSHPESLFHLTNDLGINLISAANNHSYDYRWKGYSETHKFLKQSGAHFAGLGFKKNIFKPTLFEHEGVSFAFNALSFLSHPYPASDKRMGLLNLRNDTHWKTVIEEMGKVEADIKILSVHQGIERQVTLETGVRGQFRGAIEKAGINLILAHHPHVARGVERYSKDSVIFYGLGNFLMLGAANMGPRPNPQDFGLFGRAYFLKDENDNWKVSAVEAVTLTDMHLKPKLLSSREGTKRLKHLNNLSRRTSGTKAVEFKIRADGTGLACYVEPPRWPYKNANLAALKSTKVGKLCDPRASSVPRPRYKPYWILPATNFELPVGL